MFYWRHENHVYWHASTASRLVRASPEPGSVPDGFAARRVGAGAQRVPPLGELPLRGLLRPPTLVEERAAKLAAMKDFVDRLSRPVGPAAATHRKGDQGHRHPVAAADRGLGEVRTGPPVDDPEDLVWPIWVGRAAAAHRRRRTDRRRRTGRMSTRHRGRGRPGHRKGPRRSPGQALIDRASRFASAVCSGLRPAVSTTTRGCEIRASRQLICLVPDQAEHVTDQVHQPRTRHPTMTVLQRRQISGDTANCPANCPNVIAAPPARRSLAPNGVMDGSAEGQRLALLSSPARRSSTRTAPGLAAWGCAAASTIGRRPGRFSHSGSSRRSTPPASPVPRPVMTSTQRTPSA